MKIRRRKLEVGVPTVAMADIAFNLVLFFIIMARAQDDSHLRWKPASVPQTPDRIQSGYRVAVSDDGKVYLNGVHLSLAQLGDNLKTQLAKEPTGKRAVLLKIHKDTLAATFEPIIQAVSEAGGDVVHVLEEDKKKTQ